MILEPVDYSCFVEASLPDEVPRMPQRAVAIGISELLIDPIEQLSASSS